MMKRFVPDIFYNSKPWVRPKLLTKKFLKDFATHIDRFSGFGFHTLVFVLSWIFFFSTLDPHQHTLSHMLSIFFIHCSCLFLLLFEHPPQFISFYFYVDPKLKKNPHGYYLKISTVGIGKERVGQSGAQEHAEMALD